ncbi:DUF2019 domain-containing protein [Haliangium sp.]|uniref:DUF2019 domain-containing protein n=1 Tax=Haliangium sp. TaxID=2663208 RepID=UPI003D11F146
MTPDELIEAYRQQAIIWGESSESGDWRRGNAAQAALTEIRDALKQSGPESRRKLLALLDDENLFVRLHAGVDALALSPEDGERVLSEIAQGPRSMTRFEAEMSLELWRSGKFEVTWWNT